MLPKYRIREEPIQPFGLFVLHHRAANRHHERNLGIDFLIRPALRRIQVAAPVRLTDHIADAPSQQRECRRDGTGPDSNRRIRARQWPG